MLDESICHFRGVGSILSLLFVRETFLANNVDPDQMPHCVALNRHHIVSYLGHALFAYDPFMGFQVRMG